MGSKGQIKAQPPQTTIMATTYLPASDSAFDSWLTNFSTLLTASPTTYGLVSGDATAVAAERTAYHTAFVAATDPATRTSVTVAAKDAARSSAESVVRPYAVSISLNAGVLDDDKVAIGVTVKKTVPTPIPPPTTSPALSLLAATPLSHQLRYYDTSTPTTKAKPFGATGIQVNRSIGMSAAVDPSQTDFYTVWTKSPNFSTFEAGDVGKVCTYFARWMTRGGPGGAVQYGPWSASLVLGIM
jgi:hypothetical protein